LKKGIAFLLAPIHFVHITFFFLSTSKEAIKQDLKRYYSISKSDIVNLIFALTFVPEFRALFYYRLGKVRYLIKWMHPVFLNLHIYTSEIGPGLKIQHGFIR
jgi:serine O-acetyltransferase